MKRTFDIVVSIICIICFMPLFVVCYILIKKEDGCSAIYQQERIGYKGKPFMIYKFRSMHVGAETDKPVLLEVEGDARLTKVGAWLRKHHLDELPQLFNVLKGDMSFVGPRPERQYFIDQILEEDSRYILLYKVRPGITSYATLYNGYTDTMEKMLKRLDMDIKYLERQSMLEDMRILWLTFFNIASGKKI